MSAGASPQTPLGELTALPRPHSCIQVATSKGEKVKKGEIWQKRGREGGEGERGEGGGKGRRGKGRKREGPHDPLAWGPQCLNPALAVVHKMDSLCSTVTLSNIDRFTDINNSCTILAEKYGIHLLTYYFNGVLLMTSSKRHCLLTSLTNF